LLPSELRLVIPLAPGFVRQSQCPIIRSTDTKVMQPEGHCFTPKCGGSLERGIEVPNFDPNSRSPTWNRLMRCWFAPTCRSLYSGRMWHPSMPRPPQSRRGVSVNRSSCGIEPPLLRETLTKMFCCDACQPCARLTCGTAGGALLPRYPGHTRPPS
jgi:hypothetical protein